MSGPDWCRWYPAKWLSGVLHLNNEQRGVYIQVINVLLDLGECSADPGYLGRLCNCNRQKAARLVGELIERGKLEQTDGKLRQNRAETERKVAANLAQSGRDSVAKRKFRNDIVSTHARVLRTTTTEDKKDISKATPSHPANAGRKRNSYPPNFEQFWLTYPKRGTDTKALAFKAWDKARKAGTDVETLYAGAERYRAYVDQTGCESAHVQTWINREGWTASHAKPNGSSHGQQPARASVVAAVRSLEQGDREREKGASDDEDDGPIAWDFGR